MREDEQLLAQKRMRDDGVATSKKITLKTFTDVLKSWVSAFLMFEKFSIASRRVASRRNETKLTFDLLLSFTLQAHLSLHCYDHHLPDRDLPRWPGECFPRTQEEFRPRSTRPVLTTSPLVLFFDTFRWLSGSSPCTNRMELPSTLSSSSTQFLLGEFKRTFATLEA